MSRGVLDLEALLQQLIATTPSKPGAYVQAVSYEPTSSTRSFTLSVRPISVDAGGRISPLSENDAMEFWVEWLAEKSLLRIIHSCEYGKAAIDSRCHMGICSFAEDVNFGSDGLLSRFSIPYDEATSTIYVQAEVVVYLSDMQLSDDPVARKCLVEAVAGAYRALYRDYVRFLMGVERHLCPEDCMECQPEPIWQPVLN